MILSRDLQHDKRFDESQSIVLGGVRSVISAPLVFEDRSFGILYLDSCSDENVFIEADAEMVGAISNQVASTLYRHDLIEQRKRVQLTAMQKLAVLAEQRDPGFSWARFSRTIGFGGFCAGPSIRPASLS